MRLLARWLARGGRADGSSGGRPLREDVAHAGAILVVALAEAGDMVLLSVFLRGLRRLAPSAHLTLVCLPGARPLFEHSSDVDEVIAYQAATPRLLRPLVLPRRARALVRRELARQYDVAIVPRWDTDHHLAAAVAVYSRAPRRVWHTEHANARKARLNAGFDALFTDVVTSGGVAHEVERHLDMLRALGAESPSGALRLELSDAERKRGTDVLAEIRVAGPLVAFGIGAAHPKRRWPISRFAEVGKTLQRELGAHIVVVGGPGDVAAQRELIRLLGSAATGAAGLLTLRESAAVIERCRLFVGSDSAPMHLAAATEVPCVEISCHPAGGDPLHNNAPERFAPWGVPSVVLRPDRPVPPCTTSCVASVSHCILAVTDAMVIEASRSLLRRETIGTPRASASTRIV